MYFGTKPYGLEDYINHHRGDGSNMLREADFAQPNTLEKGDVLSSGWEDEDRFTGFNGSVGLRFTNGLSRVVAPRLPLRLRSERNGVLPGQLQVGDILQTGCVVLDVPKAIGRAEWHDGQEEVEIDITGGWKGHDVGVPNDIELAVYDEVYPPSSTSEFGKFVLQETLHMHEVARRNLPKLGQLALEI